MIHSSIRFMWHEDLVWEVDLILDLDGEYCPDYHIELISVGFVETYKSIEVIEFLSPAEKLALHLKIEEEVNEGNFIGELKEDRQERRQNDWRE